MRESFKESVDAFKAVLERASSFLVTSHTNPDGDAIGSLIAMGLFLKSLGKDVVMYNRDEVPYNFKFLEGAAEIVHQVSQKPDCTILCDCGAPGRIGEDFPDFGWGEDIVVVDHHKSYDPDFATLYIRDITAASAGEVVYEIIKAHGELDFAMAQAIYTAIVTDTNSFRYGATKPKTFENAGDMLAMGVSPWDVTQHVYESQPIERIRLLSRILETLRISNDGKLASLVVTRATVEEFAASDDLVDGFINYARGILGVEIATQIMEEPDSVWRVSFRSKGKIDCSLIAEKFGGGGHHNRAGCRITGSREEVEKALADALTEVIQELEDESKI